MQRAVSLDRKGNASGVAARLKELGSHIPEFEDLEGTFSDLDRRARSFIKKRPEVCLVGALALGFLVGRLVRDRG